MKSRIVLSAIALVSSLVFVVGIAGCGGTASQGLSGLLVNRNPALPAVTQFVSRQAPLVVSLLVRPDRLRGSSQALPLIGKRGQIQQEWQLAKATLTDWTGWDYEADLQPWLGQEVSFAVTHADLDYDAESGSQAGYLVALECRDGQKAREALYELWQKRRALSGYPWTLETVSGVPLVHDGQFPGQRKPLVAVPGTTSPKLPALASAVVGDRYVLLANHPDVIRQAISTFQAPDISLARDEGYRDTVYAQPANRVGWLYANVPQLLAWLGIEADSVSQPPPQTDRTLHHLFVSLRAAAIGLRGEITMVAAPGAQFMPPPDVQGTFGETLQLLPADTLFVASGPDLSSFLEGIKTNVSGYPVSLSLLQQLLTSLSLPTADELSILLDSFKGDYALALVNHSPPSWVLLSPSESGPNWAQLDDVAQRRGLTVNHIKPDLDQELVVWSRISLTSPFSLSTSSADEVASLEARVIGVHTQDEAYEVFSTSLLGLQAVLGSTEESSLLMAKSPFKETLTGLEHEVGSLFYLDWLHLSPLLVNQFPLVQAIDQLTQPLTAHLSSLAVTNFAGTTAVQEGVVAVKLVQDKEELTDL